MVVVQIYINFDLVITWLNNTFRVNLSDPTDRVVQLPAGYVTLCSSNEFGTYSISSSSSR